MGKPNLERAKELTAQFRERVEQRAKEASQMQPAPKEPFNVAMGSVLMTELALSLARIEALENDIQTLTDLLAEQET